MSNQISIVGDLSNGVLILNQENLAFPTNPSIGMLVIKGLTLYSYITIAGITKWYPLIQRDLNNSNYIGTQNINSITWIVQHNLDTIQYYYQVRDINGDVIIPSQLIPIDNNSFKLVFATQVSGSILVISTSNLFIDQLAIGDGVNVKITKADQEQLNFIAGNGISITFDNNNKNIIITNTGNGSNGTNSNIDQIELSTTIASTGLNFDGSYPVITNTTYLNNSVSLINADNLLSQAIANEASRASAAETNLSTLISNINTTKIVNTSTVANNQLLDVFNILTCRSAKYLIQIKYGNSFQVTELLVVHNGVTPYITELGNILTDFYLANFSADININNFELLISPLYMNLTITVIRTIINI